MSGLLSNNPLVFVIRLLEREREFFCVILLHVSDCHTLSDPLQPLRCCEQWKADVGAVRRAGDNFSLLGDLSTHTAEVWRRMPSDAFDKLN